MTVIEIECNSCGGTLSCSGGSNCDEVLECGCGSRYVVTVSELHSKTPR